MFVFQKIWHAFFSYNARFEIATFAILPTNQGESNMTDILYLNFLKTHIYNDCGQSLNYYLNAISYHLHNSRKREEHSWKSDTFSKVTGFSVKLYKKYNSSVGVFYVF